MSDWDVVVAGAGHNSLVCAAYLARAGLRVLVLERAAQIGGDTSTEELTLPGFKHDACASAHVLIQTSPILRDDELRLEDHGLRYLFPDPVVVMPFADGRSLTMFRERAATVREIGRFSPRDARAYEQLLDDWDLVKAPLNRGRYSPPGLPSAGLAALEATPPGLEAVRWRLSSALPKALAGVIRACGGEIRTDAEVVRVLVEDGRAAGVVTADGAEHRAARAVVSTIHTKHLPVVVGREALGDRFVSGLDHWRTGVTMFVTHYALDAPARYQLEQGPTASTAAGIADSTEHLLTALTQFRRGVVHLDRPPLLVVSSSVADPSRAPAGRHTLKIVGFLPYDLRDGGPTRWDAIKDDVSEALLDHYLGYTTGLTRRNILARHVESPLDLERRNPHNYRGSCHGGDQDLAQEGALRPVPGWGHYRLPVTALYQTGATTHPGASVTGAPGRNCARVVLEDLGLSLEQAIEAGRGAVTA